MSSQQLKDLFEAGLASPAADTIDVDAAIARGQRRRRRRVGATVVASAAAVVVAALLVAGLLPPRTTGSVAPGDGTPLPIPTSQWKDGDDSMAALAEGVLVLRPDSCLVLVSDTVELVVAWPAGFTAVQRIGGIDVLGTDGSVVAREGEQISLGGGEGSIGLTGPCLGGVTPVFAVNQAPPYDRSVATQVPVVWGAAQSVADLYGTWTVVELLGQGMRSATDDEGRPFTVQARAEGERSVLSGSDGCNVYGGTYTIGDGGAFEGEAITTAMACTFDEPPLFSAIAEARRAELSSATPQQLRLLSADGTVLAIYERDTTATDAPADWTPARSVDDLQGTWLAVELGGEDVAGAVDLRGSPLVLAVRGSGLSAQDGRCNEIEEGLQVQDDGRLALSPPSVTAVGCDQRRQGWPAAGVAAYEARAAQVLDDGGDTPRRLRLSAEDGTVLGEYVEVPGSTGSSSTAGILCLDVLDRGDGSVDVTHARLTTVDAARTRTGGPSDTSPAAEPWSNLSGSAPAAWCTSRVGSTWSVTAVTEDGPPVTFMSAGTPLGDPGVDGPAIP